MPEPNDSSRMIANGLNFAGLNAQELMTREDVAARLQETIENLPDTFRKMGNVPDAIKMGAESMQQILGAGMEPTNKPASTIAPAPPKARVRRGPQPTLH